MTENRKRNILKFGSGVVCTVILWIILANIWSPTKKVHFRLEVPYSIEDVQFRSTMSSLLGPPLLGCNRITPLQNGEQIFPAMLRAIAQAQSSITMETFIYWSGHVGQQFTDALVDRAHHGVKVDIMLDWIGSRKFDRKLLKTMEAAGIHVEFYHPVRWYDLDRLNNRTHRRTLVIDGRIGFIGGVGIADEWDGNGMIADHWRDSHFLVEGPVVSQLQATFSDNWMRTQDDVLHGSKYFPAEVVESCPSKPGSIAQVFKSSSKEGSGSARFMFLYAIAAARKSIDIANAYFIPDPQAVEELVKAQKRGVRVRVLVPSEKTDSQVVLKASHSTWGELIRNGIEIWTYEPAMLHQKVMMVDSVWTSVGSTNFDPRSFRLNDEANLNVFDRNFAQELIHVFETDLGRGKKVSLQDWENRPAMERFTDWLTSSLIPQL